MDTGQACIENGPTHVARLRAFRDRWFLCCRNPQSKEIQCYNVRHEFFFKRRKYVQAKFLIWLSARNDFFAAVQNGGQLLWVESNPLYTTISEGQ
jgi:hypothetical protein